MAPNPRPRIPVKEKGTSKGERKVTDPSSNGVDMQDAPPKATSFLPQATAPVNIGRSLSLLGSPGDSLSSHTLGHEPQPAQICLSRRRSSPGHPATLAYSGVRLKPSPSADNIAKRRPEYDNSVSQPPGYVRHPGPALRQSNATDWPHGVLSGGALIRILEDLSRSSRNDHRQACIWLVSFATRFGRIHNLDGLIVTNAQDMHMLVLAHGFWLGMKDVPAGGDTSGCQG